MHIDDTRDAGKDEVDNGYDNEAMLAGDAVSDAGALNIALTGCKMNEIDERKNESMNERI